MKELFDVVEDLLGRVIQHYGTKVDSIIIGGPAIEEEDVNKPLFVLIVIKGVKKISFLARQEIVEYFMKKVEAEKVYANYVISTGHRPLIYTLLVDPSELEYHIPLVVYLSTKGVLVYGKMEVPKLPSFGNVIRMGEINRGDVIDL